MNFYVLSVSCCFLTWFLFNFFLCLVIVARNITKKFMCEELILLAFWLFLLLLFCLEKKDVEYKTSTHVIQMLIFIENSWNVIINFYGNNRKVKETYIRMEWKNRYACYTMCHICEHSQFNFDIFLLFSHWRNEIKIYLQFCFVDVLHLLNKQFVLTWTLTSHSLLRDKIFTKVVF